MELHKIIMKQTILIGISVCCSIIFYIISGIQPVFSNQIWTHITANSICIWLMFGCANKYWDRLVQICCCFCCCYTKVMKHLEKQTNKDSNKTESFHE